jgi:PAS domain S-box-containing protein
VTQHKATNGEADQGFLEESLEDLYEHAPCGYVSTLPNGTFAKVNQTFLTWTGFTRDDLFGSKRFQDLLTVAGKIFHETHYAPLLQMQGFVNEIAFDLVCRDGRRLPVLVSTLQKRNASGAPLFNRTTIFNASERRQYEREIQLARKKAEEALALRNQFLTIASHELRTPLTAILGNIELLKRRVTREDSLGTRDQRTLQIILDQTYRLNKMIMSLLDVSRIETGQLEIEMAAVELVALVKRVVDDVKAIVDDRQIELICPLQQLTIQGDELRLEQVFQNLLQNSLKYSSRNTAITVTVRQDQSQVYVAVHDNGIGIPQAAIPQLFEQFYRAGNVNPENISGFGIGLYVVGQIVELHGGTVTVESIEGQESTFTVSLPLADV